MSMCSHYQILFFSSPHLFSSTRKPKNPHTHTHIKQGKQKKIHQLGYLVYIVSAIRFAFFAAKLYMHVHTYRQFGGQPSPDTLDLGSVYAEENN